jgi:hypothetical protein
MKKNPKKKVFSGMKKGSSKLMKKIQKIIGNGIKREGKYPKSLKLKLLIMKYILKLSIMKE